LKLLGKIDSISVPRIEVSLSAALGVSGLGGTCLWRSMNKILKSLIPGSSIGIAWTFGKKNFLTNFY